MTEGIEKLIERKNKKLQEASEKMRRIGEIAYGLADMSITERGTTAIQMCRCAGYTIRYLAYICTSLEQESQLALPEAEQEQGGENDVIEF